mmetsp:Transcript_27688/g.61065  ORF Transcript_27688/g.61065 Transcript_27688/m.61065 type:complete len:2168 (+) Transcript_27688:29-6532(+)
MHCNPACGALSIRLAFGARRRRVGCDVSRCRPWTPGATRQKACGLPAAPGSRGPRRQCLGARQNAGAGAGAHPDPALPGGLRRWSTPCSALEVRLPLAVPDGAPADGAVPVRAALHPQDLALARRRALQELHDLADGQVPDRRGVRGLGGLQRGGQEALVEGRPGRHVRGCERDPARGAVAQGLALDADLGRVGHLLGPLQHLDGLALRERPDGRLGNARAAHHLLQGHLLQDAVVLGACLGVLRAGVALDGDPALRLVLQGPAPHPRDAALLRDGPLHEREELAHGELPDDLAVLDVLLVGDGDRGGAGVERLVGLCAGHAFLVPDGEPAGGAVRGSLAPRAQAVLEGDAPRPLDELEHLVRLQGAHDVRGALALELLLQRRLHPAGVVRLLDLLQEGRALVALEGDPALGAVDQGPGFDARHPQLRLRLRALQRLHDLLDLRLAARLGLADLELVRDGDGLHHHEVLLQEGEEAPPADAAGLDVPAEEPCLLGRAAALEAEALELPAERLLGDLLRARCELLEELLQGEALLLNLAAERSGRLGVLRVHYGLAGGLHGLRGGPGRPVRGVHLDLHLGQLLSGLQHRPVRELREQALLLLDARRRLGGGLVVHREQLLDLLPDRGRRGEARHRVLVQRLQRLGRSLHALRAGLQRGHLLGRGRRHGLRLRSLLRLDVGVLLSLLLPEELALPEDDLLLQHLQAPQGGGHLRPHLQELHSGLRQRAVLQAAELLLLLGDEAGPLQQSLAGLVQLLAQLGEEVVEGVELLQVQRALVALQGDEARLAGGDDGALHPEHAALVGDRRSELLQDLAGLDLRRGLALGDLEGVRHGHGLQAGVALPEHVLELGEAQSPVLVRVQVREDGGAPLLGEAQLLPRGGLRQLLQPREEGLPLRTLPARAGLLEDVLLAELLLDHVLPQDLHQPLHAGDHQELLGAQLDDGGTGVRGLLQILLHGRDGLGRLLQDLLGHVLLLVGHGDLLVLRHLLDGLLHALLERLQLLLEGRGALVLLLPRGQEGAGLVELGLGGLGDLHQLLAGGLGLLGGQLVGDLREEGLHRLRHPLQLGLCGVQLLARLLHLGGLLPPGGVLPELRELGGEGADALGQRRELLGGRLARGQVVVLHLEALRGEERAGLAHRLLHSGGGRLGGLDGLRGLPEGQDLDALEEGQLGLVHLLHGVLDLLHLLLALLDEHLDHDPLALLLGLGQEGRELLLCRLAPLHQLRQGRLQRVLRVGHLRLQAARRGLQSGHQRRGGGADLLDGLVRGRLQAQAGLDGVAEGVEALDVRLRLLDGLLLLVQDLLGLDEPLRELRRLRRLGHVRLGGVEAALQLAQLRGGLAALRRAGLLLLAADHLPSLEAGGLSLLLGRLRLLPGRPELLHGDHLEAVLGEGRGRLGQGLHLLLGRADAVHDLGQQRSQLPLVGVLLEGGELLGRGLRAGLDLRQLLGHALRELHGEPLDFQELRPDEALGLVEQRARELLRCIALPDGLRGLFRRQHLDALQERHLGFLALGHLRLRLLHLLPARDEHGLGTDPLPLSLQHVGHFLELLLRGRGRVLHGLELVLHGPGRRLELRLQGADRVHDLRLRGRHDLLGRLHFVLGHLPEAVRRAAHHGGLLHLNLRLGELLGHVGQSLPGLHPHVELLLEGLERVQLSLGLGELRLHLRELQEGGLAGLGRVLPRRVQLVRHLLASLRDLGLRFQRRSVNVGEDLRKDIFSHRWIGNVRRGHQRDRLGAILGRVDALQDRGQDRLEVLRVGLLLLLHLLLVLCCRLLVDNLVLRLHDLALRLDQLGAHELLQRPESRRELRELGDLGGRGHAALAGLGDVRRQGLLQLQQRSHLGLQGVRRRLQEGLGRLLRRQDGLGDHRLALLLGGIHLRRCFPHPLGDGPGGDQWLPRLRGRRADARGRRADAPGRRRRPGRPCRLRRCCLVGVAEEDPRLRLRRIPRDLPPGPRRRREVRDGPAPDLGAAQLRPEPPAGEVRPVTLVPVVQEDLDVFVPLDLLHFLIVLPPVTHANLLVVADQRLDAHLVLLGLGAHCQGGRGPCGHGACRCWPRRQGHRLLGGRACDDRTGPLHAGDSAGHQNPTRRPRGDRPRGDDAARSLRLHQRLDASRRSHLLVRRHGRARRRRARALRLPPLRPASLHHCPTHLQRRQRCPGGGGPDALGT